jgi:hypothetical protein
MKYYISFWYWNDIILLVASAVDRGFEPQSGQIKDYETGICCFSALFGPIKLA